MLFRALFCFGLVLCSQTGDILLDVPFVKQEKDGCGSASIAMVMKYWHNQRPGSLGAPEAAEIQTALYSRERRGILASGMIRYFEQHGFRAFAIAGEWKDIESNLKQGRPLIAALKAGGGDLHYVVLTGFNMDTVIKHDPVERKWVKQRREEFEREWKGAGFWTLVALPRS